MTIRNELIDELLAGQDPASAVQRLLAEYETLLRRSRFQALAVTTEHALRAGSLPGPHCDPCDRILIAQSSLESLPIISADAVLAGYGVDVVWNNTALPETPPPIWETSPERA